MNRGAPLSERLPWLLMLALLLLASAARFHRLGEQSLWYDEGVAAAHAARTLPELIPLLQRNVHVPAYFSVLGWWEDVAGASEFSLRSLSAFFSVLSIAWCYALGARLFHPIAGLVAAALVALNSFNIYYAQEARMYAMLCAVAAAGMWLLVGQFRAPDAAGASRRRLVSIAALGGVNALGMYTHVVYALVIVVQGALALLWFGGALSTAWRSDQGKRDVLRSTLDYLLANILTVLLFAPWLSVALTQVFAQPNLGASAPLDLVLRQVQGYFAFGKTFEVSMGNLGFVVYFFLLFGLIVNGSRGQSWQAMLLPPLWVALSVAVYLHFDLGLRYLRFLLPAQLGLALWMGRGVWMLWARKTRDRQLSLRYVPKLAAALASGALLLSMFGGLSVLYHHSDFQRDDVRGLAAKIEAELRANDAIVVSAAGFEEVLRYYYRGEAPVFGLPTVADDEITREQTTAIIRDYERVFAIFYGAAEQDPRGIVESTLNRLGYEISDEWIDDLRFVQYLSPTPLMSHQKLEQRFGDHIFLRSAALSATSLQPGDVLQARLTWSTEAALDARYKVFLQLLNADGVLAAQRDSEPGGGSSPTIHWPTGTEIPDNHALKLPSTLPAGDYTLIAGLYDIHDASARLSVADATYVELATIRVE